MTTRIKICGVTNEADMLATAEAGADMLGFVFHEKSPRYVAPEVARDLIAALRARVAEPPLTAGVFVKTPPDGVARVASLCGLDIAQLHSTETNDEARALRRRGLRVWKAFRLREPADVERLATFDVDGWLCDTPSEALWGGTGRTFDHSLLDGLSARYRLILAGGLTPDNIAAAVRRLRPWGVDVSSGVETAPGKKDLAKVQAFIAAVRDADRSVT